MLLRLQQRMNGLQLQIEMRESVIDRVQILSLTQNHAVITAALLTPVLARFP